MTILAVDLAAKYSAACLMDDSHRVLKEFDSWDLTEDAFIYRLSSFWMRPETPEVMIVEDLPHGLSYSGVIKTVCRLQGRIAQAMHDTTDGDWNDIVFAAPAAWRAHHGLKRGTGITALFETAWRYGYTPPDFTERAKGNGGRTRAQKVQSDYCSAYLIARWAIDMKKQHGTYDVAETSRYNTKAIKKERDDQER